MSITGTVQGGKVILPANIAWPSGTLVRIEPFEELPISEAVFTFSLPGGAITTGDVQATLENDDE